MNEHELPDKLLIPRLLKESWKILVLLSVCLWYDSPPANPFPAYANGDMLWSRSAVCPTPRLVLI